MGENVTGYRLGVLPCGTTVLLKRRGRVLHFRSKGPLFNPQPGHEEFLRAVTFIKQSRSRSDYSE